MARWEHLADLDELVLRCRDEQAKRHVAEAVACYRAGAFRQSIVATWIAVVFDIIGKLRQLELAGDKNAAVKIQSFELIRQSADVKAALAFERAVLEMAKDEFQLLSALQYEDLKRLYDDRNRCAHPSMVSEEEPYQPSAELARTHLRNAVEHLLQYPPVQGKAALGRLMAEVNSPYFPTKVEDAIRHFALGPLSRPRDALVRDFAICLMKGLLLDPQFEQWIDHQVTALNALRTVYRDITESSMATRLSDIVRRVDDDDLSWVLGFLSTVSDTWQFLSDDLHIRLGLYVERMPEDHLVPGLLYALDVLPLKHEATGRISSLSGSQLTNLIDSDPRPEFIDRALHLDSDSGSFDEANRLGRDLIAPMVKYLDREHIDAILRIAADNSQVGQSRALPRIVQMIIDARHIPEEELSVLLSRYDFVTRNDWLTERIHGWVPDEAEHEELL